MRCVIDYMNYMIWSNVPAWVKTRQSIETGTVRRSSIVCAIDVTQDHRYDSVQNKNIYNKKAMLSQGNRAMPL